MMVQPMKILKQVIGLTKKRIEDNYSDMLSSYAEFMADLHDWHKMLGL